jgi:hypothetical protein
MHENRLICIFQNSLETWCNKLVILCSRYNENYSCASLTSKIFRGYNPDPHLKEQGMMEGRRREEGEEGESFCTS